MSEKKKSRVVGVKLMKSKTEPFSSPIKVQKSEHDEQIDAAASIAAGNWIPHTLDMTGLETLVQNSTILPQCIHAYKNNIAGFGISVQYIEDIDETAESKKEWDELKRIIDLLNLDVDTKEIFEKVIESKETYGIAYVEGIRNTEGNVVGIVNIEDTKSIDMTYPLDPYIDITLNYKGEQIVRQKKFKKYRQCIGGKTVYFKEFGDPRIMDKRSGKYLEDGETLEINNQANEMLEFKIGQGYYGLPRWIGCALTIDGDYRAEKLNNNYFRNGRHTPLMIMIEGGTLSKSAYDELEKYMDEIKGEDGQHAFLLLEVEKTENTTDFDENVQPKIEVKDLASILQRDGLFQEYQEKSRKKAQSAFLLPDLYTGYTTDFNRSTAQTAMEITEKQVFQPERASLAWIINNRLLNEYGFKYVQAQFDAPDMTNPDDIFRILSVTEKAGGLTMNDAREIARKTIGKEAEEYPGEFDMTDIGNVPLAAINAMTALREYGVKKEEPSFPPDNTSGNKPFDGDMQEGADEVDQNLDSSGNGPVAGDSINSQLDGQIEKAMRNHDDEIVAVMKEVRRMLRSMQGGDGNVA